MATPAEENTTAVDRESGVVKRVEREAAASQLPARAQASDELSVDVDTDARTPGAVAGCSPDEDDGDEAIIEVADDEIAEIDRASAPARPTQPSPTFAGAQRSRPPAPPSLRPRASSGLPPPPRAPLPGREPGASSLPPPKSADPWARANQALELSRAQARVIALEEQVAFRDARIATLEERLAHARQKIQDLEQKLGPSSSRMRARGAAPGVQLAGKGADGERQEGSAARPEGEATDASLAAEDLAASATSGGELSQISSIGPRFEAALRRQGITRLSQIAAWSEADVRQVAKALKIPKSRIVKGRWVESAREAIGEPTASE